MSNLRKPKFKQTPVSQKAQRVMAEAAAVRRFEAQMAAENAAQIKGVVELALAAGGQVLKENFDFDEEQAAEWMKLTVPRLNQLFNEVKAKRPTSQQGK